MVLTRLESTLAAGGLPTASEQPGTVLDGLRAVFDPEGVGGAHLLGTRGVVVIAHGSSSRRAVANAADLAREGVEDDLVAKVEAGVSVMSPVPG